MFGLGRKKLQGVEFLDGVTDIHCHLLPGVDDGMDTLTNSLDLLGMEEYAGVKRIYFTPHSMGRSGAAVDPNSYGRQRHRHQARPPVFANARDKNSIVPAAVLMQEEEHLYEEADQQWIVEHNNSESEPLGGFSNAHLCARFAKFKEFYRGNIDIRLAAEYMMNKEFLDKVKGKDVLTYSDGVHVLVETSYSFPPIEMDEILYTIQLQGYRPIIAHPERYNYMQWDDYKKLKDKGLEFQLNYLSLTKYYGEQIYYKAIDLLDAGFYTYAGSDLHRISAFDVQVPLLKLNFKRSEKLQQLFANNEAL